MRKQYHFQPSDRGTLAWDVDRLVALSQALPRTWLALTDIRELDEPFWFGPGDVPTCRVVAEHARLITETDLRHPIILASNGRVMDGMHRVCKAVLAGLAAVEAVRFVNDPAPDYVGVNADELPYDDGTALPSHPITPPLPT